ncbi:cupin domain-containing protein [Mycolicibacterium sediminis]|uniref:Cupin n=1 Tax=Mycolicibacterium sediminis TaxID=1286180 RepID=A0A7I7QXM6_9MYCO|nr:cupin domain-containing protein [Mycolicibacterium sediminis]BBY31133.1 hypothetical protein MSEDJ_52290 [Mycolicibacterium sediminis]
MFTYAFFVPAGVWDPPHHHCADVHLIVLSGELRLGIGEEFTPSAAETFPSGRFLHVPAGRAHFDGAEVDTVLIGTAVGPWSTEYVSSAWAEGG